MSDYETKRSNLYSIERLKDRLVNAQLADPATKHRTRRAVSEIGKRVSMIRGLLRDRKSEVDCAVEAAKAFQDDLNRLSKFCEKTEKAIQLVENATIFTPSGTDLDYVRSQETETDQLARALQTRWNDACSKEPSPDARLKIVSFTVCMPNSPFLLCKKVFWNIENQ
ncbi:unnamed protein product [Gongylonema pulchrum]|uniref:Uncharacterized protein n=1 Tax=Gongylonema pulchrum TaxID=637853 RepID=A0A3P7N443_9BILA|nr:unnamed protein product [Gongylonema pulchrum]